MKNLWNSYAFINNLETFFKTSRLVLKRILIFERLYNLDGTLGKKQGESSSNSGPMIAGVTVAVLVLIFLLIVAFLYWRRRSKMADRSILFYKDSSTTPLQNDFDEDLIKSHEDIGGMSRVQFT